MESCSLLVVLLLQQIPFSIVLRQPGEENLERIYETYHGSNISIQVMTFFIKSASKTATS